MKYETGDRVVIDGGTEIILQERNVDVGDTKWDWWAEHPEKPVSGGVNEDMIRYRICSHGVKLHHDKEEKWFCPFCEEES